MRLPNNVYLFTEPFGLVPICNLRVGMYIMVADEQGLYTPAQVTYVGSLPVYERTPWAMKCPKGKLNTWHVPSHAKGFSRVTLEKLAEKGKIRVHSEDALRTREFALNAEIIATKGVAYIPVGRGLVDIPEKGKRGIQAEKQDRNVLVEVTTQSGNLVNSIPYIFPARDNLGYGVRWAVLGN